jgi:hypothetical protein
MPTFKSTLKEYEIPVVGYNDIRKKVEMHLDGAAAKDEIDAVTFGLETSDGDLVKIYVAATDADGFEKAMAERFRNDVSVEDLINDLADEFDIVDVEWPDGDDDDTDAKTATEPPRGAESMNGEINQGDISEEDDVTDGTASLSYGQRVAKRMLGESTTGVGNFAVHQIMALLKDIGLPEKVIRDNDAMIYKIIRRKANDTLPTNVAAVTAIRLYVDAINKKKPTKVSEAVAELPAVNNGELSQYFSNKYQDLIYSIFAAFGLDDAILTRKGNKDLVVDHVIAAGNRLKNQAKKFALLKDVYDALSKGKGDAIEEEMDIGKYQSRSDATNATMILLTDVLCIPPEIIQKCPALTSYLLSSKRDGNFRRVYQDHRTVISALLNSMKTTK